MIAAEARDPQGDHGPPCNRSPCASGRSCQQNYAENELPQPQPPVEFGFLKVKPEPCMDVT
jgi:hypothetical protein